MSLLAALGLKPRATVNDHRSRQHAQRLFARLEQGSWTEVEHALATGSEEHRELLLSGIADQAGAVAVATRWVQAAPRCAMAPLLLGAGLVSEAWQIRGSAHARQVDIGAWAPLQQRLEQAVPPLQAAAELDPALADAHGWLIAAEACGDGDWERIKGLFRAAIARSPLHWGVHYRYFMATTEKWCGSHKEMFGFARTVTALGPKGSPLHCLLAAACCEYALAQGEAARATLRTRQCAAEIRAALYAWLDTNPANLQHRLPALDGGVADLALNHFAVACYLCGAAAEARILLDALRGQIHTIPWAWIAAGMRERSDTGFVHDRVRHELARA